MDKNFQKVDGEMPGAQYIRFTPAFHADTLHSWLSCLAEMRMEILVESSSNEVMAILTSTPWLHVR